MGIFFEKYGPNPTATPREQFLILETIRNIYDPFITYINNTLPADNIFSLYDSLYSENIHIIVQGSIHGYGQCEHPYIRMQIRHGDPKVMDAYARTEHVYIPNTWVYNNY